MSTNTLDAALTAKMFLAGAKNLSVHKDWINELNVFPVPDGDTGTNMTMTIMSAAKEVSAMHDVSMKTLAKAMSSGSLRGARGNSGVILSQLLRGLCKVMKDYETVDTEILCAAFNKAVETAYKAVMKPKEGTILTVARGFAERANELIEEDPAIEMEDLLRGAIEHADEVLAETPEMLPVLKEAGVVDSGGQGLMEIIKGAFDCFCGKEVSLDLEEEPSEEEVKTEQKADGYCVEFVIIPYHPVSEQDETALEEFLQSSGEMAALLSEDGKIKIHLHVKDPGPVISRAVALGGLSSVKIESLSGEHTQKVITPADLEKIARLKAEKEKASEPVKEVGFVSVCAGEGLAGIFRDLGIDGLIEGGQTMNPSTEDVINAIEGVKARTVFVFPNNKNIILAASQAKDLVKDKKVVVIPTKTVPQGITAMLSYMPDMSVSENETQMYEAIKQVRTCQLTYAIRDTHVEDKTIHEGDIMGVGDKGILAVGQDISETAVSAVGQMMDESSELISLYYGEDIREEEAAALAEQLRSIYTSCDIECTRGGQPIYYYIISVE